MVSEEIIEKINIRTDLPNLIKRYLPLQESRKALKGNCPFHQDTNLSFMVLPAKNNFKCFGCGVEGGAIHFLSMIERKTFEDAAAMLAKQLGISERLSA